MNDTDVVVTKGVDIGELDLVSASDVAFEFEVVSPKDERGLGVFISVVGENADRVQRVLRGEFNRRRKLEVQMQKRNKQEATPIEEDEQLAIESCVARTVGWRGLTKGGAEFPFTAENARKLYTSNSAIRAQVAAASNNVANFSKK